MSIYYFVKLITNRIISIYSLSLGLYNYNINYIFQKSKSKTDIVNILDKTSKKYTQHMFSSLVLISKILIIHVTIIRVLMRINKSKLYIYIYSIHTRNV